MTDYAGLIPVNVITGFLGSGKTTLLTRLLRSPKLSDTVVLINEFGEVGLDHHLVEHVAESTLLLENGCLCCAIRGDLQESLRDLYSKRERGEIPPFRRVVIETSGLADPVPIAFTILSEPVLQHHYRLGNIITTIDAVNGAQQLSHYSESNKQAAVADRLVLTKTDLANAQQTDLLRRRLAALNAGAPVLLAGIDEIDPEFLLTHDMHGTDGRAAEMEQWLRRLSATPEDALQHRHGSGIASFTLRFDGALDWTAFGIWMTMLLHRHGDKVLRIKGMLNVAGVATPVLINGVQHIVHPPTHLERWPDDDRSSRIVFITDGLARQALENSLSVFCGLADAPRSDRSAAMVPAAAD